jgi:hypothetical protein
MIYLCQKNKRKKQKGGTHTRGRKNGGLGDEQNEERGVIY